MGQAGAVLVFIFCCSIASRGAIGSFDWEGGGGCAPEWTKDGLKATNARGTIGAGTGSDSVSNGTYSSTDLELLMVAPFEHPPRIHSTTIHPETGEFYIPVSHLTHGREYWVRRSTDMENWTDLWKIEAVKPVLNVVIPEEFLAPSSFYRVEERE